MYIYIFYKYIGVANIIVSFVVEQLYDAVWMLFLVVCKYVTLSYGNVFHKLMTKQSECIS